MTAIVMRVLEPHVPLGVALSSTTGSFGARYISSRSAAAIAGHAALDCYAKYGRDCDAVYLACFGDPGLLALKELARVPVIGMAEASCAVAAEEAERFSIVTGGERWGPILREFVEMLGFGEHLATVETVAPTGGEIACNPNAAITLLADACRRTAERDGAGAVILGGAGLAGLAAHVQPLVNIPVICSVEAGFRTVLAAAAAPAPKPIAGDLALPDPVESVALSPALAALLTEP
jgi:allantoin racemase